MKKIIKNIDEDDWYPVYSLVGSYYGESAEFTKKQLKRIKKAFKEFEEVQDLLEKLYLEKI